MLASIWLGPLLSKHQAHWKIMERGLAFKVFQSLRHLPTSTLSTWDPPHLVLKCLLFLSSLESSIKVTQNCASSWIVSFLIHLILKICSRRTYPYPVISSYFYQSCQRKGANTEEEQSLLIKCWILLAASSLAILSNKGDLHKNQVDFQHKEGRQKKVFYFKVV